MNWSRFFPLGLLDIVKYDMLQLRTNIHIMKRCCRRRDIDAFDFDSHTISEFIYLVRIAEGSSLSHKSTRHFIVIIIRFFSGNSFSVVMMRHEILKKVNFLLRSSWKIELLERDDRQQPVTEELLPLVRFLFLTPNVNDDRTLFMPI